MPDWITRYWVEWLFGIVAAMMVAGYQRVSKHMRHAQKKDRALDDGMRALLRDRIISACDHYLEKGFALCMPGKTSPACMMPTTVLVGMELSQTWFSRP